MNSAEARAAMLTMCIFGFLIASREPLVSTASQSAKARLFEYCGLPQTNVCITFLSSPIFINYFAPHDPTVVLSDVVTREEFDNLLSQLELYGDVIIRRNAGGAPCEIRLAE